MATVTTEAAATVTTEMAATITTEAAATITTETAATTTVPVSLSRHPEVLWAQRSDMVYLTVALPDAKDVSVKCEPQGLFRFSAKGVRGESFDFALLLYGTLVPEVCTLVAGDQGKYRVRCEMTDMAQERGSITKFTNIILPYLIGFCKTRVGLRNILCSIQKEQKGWWERLLKSEEKPAPYLKVDWNKWCDEDDESNDSDLADDDATMHPHEDGDSDDEGMLYLPDLEKVRGTL